MRFPRTPKMLRLSSLFLFGSVLICCSSALDESSPEGDILPSLEHVAQIGCLDCDGPELLSVLSLTLASDGMIYLLDHYEPFVRVFEPDGEMVRAFGIAGQGPGELGADVQVEYLPGIGLYPSPDGSVLAHEAIPPTLTAFNSEGEFSQELRLEMPLRVPRATAWNMALERLFLISFLPGEGSQVDRFDFGGRAFAPAETVLLLSDAFPPTDEEPPWPATPLSIASTPTGGFAIGDPWRYLIRLFGPDGEMEAQITRDIERPRKGDAEMEELRERLRQGAALTGSSAEEPHPEASHFPRGALDFDDNGRLWVATNRGAEGITIFDLFDLEGAYVGEVTVPAVLKTGPEILRAFAVAGGYLAAVVVDGTGNDLIGVWRIAMS